MKSVVVVILSFIAIGCSVTVTYSMLGLVSAPYQLYYMFFTGIIALVLAKLLEVKE